MTVTQLLLTMPRKRVGRRKVRPSGAKRAPIKLVGLEVGD